MKKVIFLFILILALPSLIIAQEVNTRMIDPKYDKEILIGGCDRSGLKLGKFGELYEEYYSIYDPDKKVVAQLKKHKEGLDIVIVLGTWCSDSQEQVPKFLKVLDKIKFDKERLSMICVDGEKQGGDVDVEPYNILYVPTFIFYKNDKEMGRIVESPVRTLEEDMLGIVSDR
jgi:hypothetical protein